jgi:hypothetical protein
MEMGACLDGCCRHAADALAITAPIAPTGLPKPLARVAMNSDEPISAFSATPNVAELQNVETAADSSINKEERSPVAVPAPTPDASVSPDAVRPPVTGPETLKSTGLKMRARTSKPSLSAAARKLDGIGSVLPTEGKTAAPPQPSNSNGNEASEADLQSGEAPKSLSRAAAGA